MQEPAQTAFDQLLAEVTPAPESSPPALVPAAAASVSRAPVAATMATVSAERPLPVAERPVGTTEPARFERPLTGNEFAELIAAYLVKNYGPRGLVVYREVHLGKSIIGKNRRVDILGIHTASRQAIAIECKYQATAGTADEKIPYTLEDLAALHIPAFAVYAGEGFSQGVLHLLRASRLAAHCLPGRDLASGPETIELDHLIATTFGWWELVLKAKQPFDLERWLERRRELP